MVFTKEELKRIIERQIQPRFRRFKMRSHLTPCWRFVGWKDKEGYGRITIRRIGEKKHFYIHRIMYAFYKGSISKNREIHHECHIRDCGNSDHLVLRTRKQNLAERTKAGKEIKVEKDAA